MGELTWTRRSHPFCLCGLEGYQSVLSVSLAGIRHPSSPISTTQSGTWSEAHRVRIIAQQGHRMVWTHGRVIEVDFADIVPVCLADHDWQVDVTVNDR